MSIQERLKGKTFQKVCRYRRCKQEFTADSPSQKFCCPEHGKLHNALRRSDSSYYKRNSVSRKERSKLRKLAVKALEASGVKKECYVCKSVKDLDAHHKDGNPENNDPKNLCWVCSIHHALLHHPPSFNKWQLDQYTTIVPERLFCKTVSRLVICTTIKCPGRKHCCGVNADGFRTVSDEGRTQGVKAVTCKVPDETARPDSGDNLQ
jgi:hypothetical protein